MKKFKLILKNIFKVFFLTLAESLIVFLLLMYFFHLLGEFKLLNLNTEIILTISGLVVITSILLIVNIVNICKKKKTKYFNTKRVRITVFYFLLILVLCSIRANIEISLETAKEIISLTWTIFAITTALIAVWILTLTNFIKNKIEKPRPESRGQERIHSIMIKSIDFAEASNYMYDIIFLIIGFSGLCFCTSLIYIQAEMNIFTQTIIYLIFSVNLHTICLIFMEIFMPIILSLKESKKLAMTNEEVDNEIDTAVLEMFVDSAMPTIEQINKNRIIAKMISTKRKKKSK